MTRISASLEGPEKIRKKLTPMSVVLLDVTDVAGLEVKGVHVARTGEDSSTVFSRDVVFPCQS